MKIVFVSGFLNNHLLPFCVELAKKNEFYFIATQDRMDKGYNRDSLQFDFVINYFEEQNKQLSENLIRESDVAIFGGSSDNLLTIRKQTGKLSFIYTERLFKGGTWRRFIPSTRKIYSNRFIENGNNTYLLCASSYVKSDVKLLGFNPEKCYRFGYLPLSGDGISEEQLSSKCNNMPVELLYVGRLIKLKRVNDVIKCVYQLTKLGVYTNLTIIGDGSERQELEKLVRKLKLEDRIRFIGFQPPDTVYYYMKKSNVLFFSSNKQEGWGAVVNEALFNGCSVLVSDSCGSAKYLIKNGINGYVYKTGNVRDMSLKAMELIGKANQESLYKAAQDTICQCWNGEIAAERFQIICNALIEGKIIDDYSDGPMSKA